MHSSFPGDTSSVSVAPAPVTDTSPPTVPPFETITKSPGLAWLLSLLFPGLGQVYCGMYKRGIDTMGVLALAVGGIVFGFSLEGDRAEDLLGIALRLATGVYLFATVDAYFTAREINSGAHRYMVRCNPRVAGVLNLLTHGFGYFYLGERKKGLAVFVVMRFVSRVLMEAMKTSSGVMAVVAGLGLEAIYILLAVDAWRIAKRKKQETMPPDVQALAPVQAETGPPAFVPMAVAVLLAIAYLSVGALGLMLPDYEPIDQSKAVISENQDRRTYRNGTYGVALHVPAEWTFDREDKDNMIAAVKHEGACNVAFIPEARWPISSLEKVSDSLREQIFSKNQNFRFEGDQPTTLGNRAAHELVVTADVDGTQVIQRYILAQHGLSLHALVATMAGSVYEDCNPQVEKIRQEIRFE
jgi:hypothetical protein